VLNGGVPGWSSVQGIRLLDLLSDYRPDFVVFWFGMNDAHPAWGRPDAEKVGDAGPLAGLRSALSELRVVQLTANGVDLLRGEGTATRASAGDFADAVERLREGEAAGGPRVLFVACPERLGVTISQLEKVLDRAEKEGVTRVAGPARLLLGVVPAAPGAELSGQVVTGPEGPELRYPGPIDVRFPLDRIRSEVESLRAIRRGVAERRSLLPDDALDAEELFGRTPLDRVFSDNCHLTPEGCRLAASAIFDRILERLPR
jgi:lysophospholipase L1-like esterase